MPINYYFHMAEIIIPQKPPKMETFEWLCVTILLLFFILLLICSAYIPFLSIVGFQSHFLVIFPSYLLYILIYSLLLPCDHKRASENSSAPQYYCTGSVLGILIVNDIEQHKFYKFINWEIVLTHTHHKYLKYFSFIPDSIATYLYRCVYAKHPHSF